MPLIFFQFHDLLIKTHYWRFNMSSEMTELCDGDLPEELWRPETAIWEVFWLPQISLSVERRHHFQWTMRKSVHVNFCDWGRVWCHKVPPWEVVEALRRLVWRHLMRRFVVGMSRTILWRRDASFGEIETQFGRYTFRSSCEHLYSCEEKEKLSLKQIRKIKHMINLRLANSKLLAFTF